MDKMRQLARDVKALEKKIAVCTSCGACQAHCPLFQQTHREADVSRGKLALIQGLVDGLFDDAKGVAERLDRCLLCGACAKNCPSGVDTVYIFLSARQLIARYLGLPFSQKVLFKKLLANPERFNLIMGLAASFQSVFFKKQDNFQGTSCARIASPLLRNRNITALAPASFNTGLSGRDFHHKGKGVKVAFFVGCLIDKAFPNIAHSVVEVLKHFDADIFIPANQGCCGIPALASGEAESFEQLVKHNTGIFSSYEFDYVVTACATCASTLIKLWPKLFKTGDEKLTQQVETLCERTVDISWLMVKRFRVDLEPNEETGRTVTCHDPCHLKKSLDVFEEPRQVIRAAGYKIKEMENNDACCGMGGSFNLKYYDISSKIGTRKASHIMDTGSSIVAASCPACMMQISDMLAGSRADIRVKHPVELYARKLSKDNKPSDL